MLSFLLLGSGLVRSRFASIPLVRCGLRGLEGHLKGVRFELRRGEETMNGSAVGLKDDIDCGSDSEEQRSQ